MKYMYLGRVPALVHDVLFTTYGEVQEVPGVVTSKDFILVDEDEKPSPKRRSRSKKSETSEQPSIEVTDEVINPKDQLLDIDVKESE